MLNQAREHPRPGKTDEQPDRLLKRWSEEQTTLWGHFYTHGGGVGSSFLARIADLGRCLVFKNESSVLRCDLKNARFRCGPLQVLLTPSRLGRAAVLSQKRGGLVSRDGVIIELESGHLLFVCENTGSGDEYLEHAIGGLGSRGELGS